MDRGRLTGLAGRIWLVFVLVVLCLATNRVGYSETGNQLPKMFVWSAQRVGSMGYSQASGFAEAVTKKTGIPTKVVPTATEMAGFLPLRAREIQLAYRGTTATYSLGCGVGASYAFEEWGPQPVRILAVAPLLVGYATTPETGIRTIADLRGKRVPDYKGWETGVQNLAALLAGGGLTKADVKMVPVAGLMGGFTALMDGKTDIACLAAESSIAFELAAKRGGIVWIESPKDPAGIRRQLTIAPWFTPGWMERGAGIKPGEPVWGTTQRHLLVGYDFLDPNIAYVTTKAIWEGYDIYKDLHPSLKYATHEVLLDYTTLFDPYHEGSVKYFKEIGVWTPELEEFQEDQIELQAKRKVAWQEAIKAAAEKKLKFEDPKWYNAVDGFWVEWLRAKNLISIPKVKYTEYRK